MEKRLNVIFGAGNASNDDNNKVNSTRQAGNTQTSIEFTKKTENIFRWKRFSGCRKVITIIKQ